MPEAVKHVDIKLFSNKIKRLFQFVKKDNFFSKRNRYTSLKSIITVLFKMLYSINKFMIINFGNI